MKIVICDDSIEDLIKIEKMLLKYKKNKLYMEYSIEKYTDSNKLSKKIEEGIFADIYILDMLMPLKTGIDIGKQIRKSDNDKIIIYTTSSDDFAMDAYIVKAARYLIKPVEEKSFFEAMEFAFSYFKIRNEPLFLIKTKEGLLSVPYSKIEYIENISRVLHVHLTDKRIIKSLFIRKSFDDEIENLINDSDFMHIHKSFVINLQYVVRLNQETMVMEKGDIIPISKKKITDVKRRYLLFVADRYC